MKLSDIFDEQFFRRHEFHYNPWFVRAAIAITGLCTGILIGVWACR